MRFPKFLDPDTDWRSAHTRWHFIGGALLTAVLLLDFSPRQALTVTMLVAGAFELGQWDDARSVPGRLGTPGYGVGIMDWLAGIAGGVVVVIAYSVILWFV